MLTCTVTVADLSLWLQQKSQIDEAITAAYSAQIVDITAKDVWIYLQDFPDLKMIAFGRFLPAPGEEAEQEKRMTPEKQASLSK
ncbi:hypothetical protein ACMC9M_14630 [Pseudomonadota bacterium 24LQ007]